MKRKLALLLAGVMTMTMLPMNLFAASTNTASRNMYPVDGATVLLEVTNPNAPNANLQQDITSSGDVDAYTLGTNLVIKLQNPIATGDSLRLGLNNAEWFFRGTTSSAIQLPSDAAATIDAVALQGGNARNIQTIFPLAGATLISGDGTASTVSGTGLTGAVTHTALGAGGEFKLTTADSLDAGSTFLPAVDGSTFTSTAGMWFVDSSSYTAASDAAMGGAYRLMASGYRGAYVRALSTNNFSKIPYVLGVFGGDAKTADVVFTSGFAIGEEITIPIVAKVIDDDKDVSVNLSGGSGYISAGTVPIFNAGGGITTSTIETATGRDNIALKKLTIAESRPGTFKSNGSFIVELSPNFKFTQAVAPSGTGLKITDLSVQFAGFSTLAAPVSYTVEAYPAGTAPSDITALQINVANLGTALTNNGVIYVDGLKVRSTNSDFFGDANITISDHSTGLGLTKATIKAATRAQYGVSLVAKTAADTIPALVTGRVTSIPDNTTKILNFKIAENTVGSWWTDRDTVISLPDGVRFTQVKVTKQDNITGTSVVATDPMTLERTYYATDAASPAGDPAKESRDIEIDGNKLTIKSSVKKTANSKSTLEFEAWVSVGQRFGANDITLAITGGGMDEASLPAPLKVATTVTPVTLGDTKLSEIKVGLQAQAVSNIVITETTAGALLSGKNIYIALSDLYGSIGGNDLVFANTAKATVTTGNVKLDTIVVGAAGTANEAAVGGVTLGSGTQLIKIPVKTRSTVASTITISDVMVKASRILPETDKESYKVFVFGNAIAENYGKSGFKNLVDAGVSAEYIYVGAPAGSVNSAAAEFKYSIAEGTSAYTVNGKEYPLADDMKGYNKNGTVMVPIRLIAEGFGLEVHWNETNRTVVVDLSTTVKAEFPVGKTFMRIGGTQVDMLDANDNLVATEITNERSYVPFRQLGYALGIASANMAWDQATSTVTFNPAK